jgi:hypothetical protein
LRALVGVAAGESLSRPSPVASSPKVRRVSRRGWLGCSDLSSHRSDFSLSMIRHLRPGHISIFVLVHCILCPNTLIESVMSDVLLINSFQSVAASLNRPQQEGSDQQRIRSCANINSRHGLRCFQRRWFVSQWGS